MIWVYKYYLYEKGQDKLVNMRIIFSEKRFSNNDKMAINFFKRILIFFYEHYYIL